MENTRIMNALAPEHISLGLHLWRRSVHATQREVAAVLGISKAAVSLKEDGQGLRADQLDRLDIQWPGAAADVLRRARAFAGLPEPAALVVAEPRPQAPAPEPTRTEAPVTDTFLHRLLNEMFEGHPLAVFVWRETLYFPAKQVGAILGYANDGHKMLEQFANEWSDKLEDKRHRVTFAGVELSDIKRSLSMIPESFGIVGARSNSLTVLTEEGLYKVLQLTGKPEGQRLRAWLSDHVLPSIRRTGKYVDPSIAEAPKVEAAAPPKVVTVDPEVERAREMRLLAKDIRRKGAAADKIDTLHLRAADLLLGLPSPAPLPAVPAPVAPPPVPPPAPEPKRILVRPGSPKVSFEAEMETFVRAWWDEYQGDLVPCAELLVLVGRLGLFRARLNASRRGRAMQLGSAVLAEHVDRVVAGFEIRRRKSGFVGYELVQR